mmetsp:Transcript_16163/g.32979  ORF Transcript_16163/g.32979 Transcript_16163/m.32979 type:complete len:494 (+) Transcript_16163:548-2029(+)
MATPVPGLDLEVIVTCGVQETYRHVRERPHDQLVLPPAFDLLLLLDLLSHERARRSPRSLPLHAHLPFPDNVRVHWVAVPSRPLDLQGNTHRRLPDDVGLFRPFGLLSQGHVSSRYVAPFAPTLAVGALDLERVTRSRLQILDENFLNRALVLVFDAIPALPQHKSSDGCAVVVRRAPFHRQTGQRRLQEVGGSALLGRSTKREGAEAAIRVRSHTRCVGRADPDPVHDARFQIRSPEAHQRVELPVPLLGLLLLQLQSLALIVLLLQLLLLPLALLLLSLRLLPLLLPLLLVLNVLFGSLNLPDQELLLPLSLEFHPVQLLGDLLFGLLLPDNVARFVDYYRLLGLLFGRYLRSNLFHELLVFLLSRLLGLPGLPLEPQVHHELANVAFEPLLGLLLVCVLSLGFKLLSTKLFLLPVLGDVLSILPSHGPLLPLSELHSVPAKLEVETLDRTALHTRHGGPPSNEYIVGVDVNDLRSLQPLRDAKLRYHLRA